MSFDDYDQLIDGKKEVVGKQQWIVVYPKTQQEYRDLIEVCCEIRCYTRDPERQRVICQVNVADQVEMEAVIDRAGINVATVGDYKKYKAAEN